MLIWCMGLIHYLGLQEGKDVNTGFGFVPLGSFGKFLYLPLASFFASLSAFPLWFVLKQVSRSVTPL
jgi:hypothetical protein